MEGQLSRIGTDGKPLGSGAEDVKDATGCAPAGSQLCALPEAKRAHLTSKTFFPHLISEPFKDGLVIAFSVSMLMCLIAAAFSWLRGGYYVNPEEAGALARSDAAEVAAAARADTVVEVAVGEGG
jgi:hypothetical protein